MNPRITDLLDDYVDTSVRLFPPEQVLGDTGSGKKKSPTPKPTHHRMKKPLVIAAALLLMVTGIAVAGLKLSNVGSTGVSLNPPQDSSWTAESSMEESTPAQQDIVLDDTNSVIVTDYVSGLSMRVPTEFQDGIKINEDYTLTAEIGSPFEQHFDFNGIFTFYDTSNLDGYYGIVFTIDAWDQSDFDNYMTTPGRELTYSLNSAVVGKKENSYYRMLQFGTPNLNVIPNFDNTNLDSAKSYYERLKYAIPMVNSFIELNGLDPVETGLSGWDDQFRQRVLEPMEELISKLENASPQQDIILDATNSVIVTSEATGLSMRVPTEYQDGLKTDHSLDLEDSLGGTYHWDSVFTFYDTSNQDGYYGIVFNMEAWEQSTFDSYLSDSIIGYTFTLNSAVVGTDGTTYYSMLQFGNPISNEFPNFNFSNLDSARAYYERLKYAIPMVNSFIELNGLDPVETGLSSWDDLFRQRMLEPMEELIAQLENEMPQQDTQETEEAANYAELDLSPAEDIHSALPSGDASSVDAATTTLTSSTGLSINVMSECMDAGEFYVDETITLENELSCNIDVVFAAFDQRNLDSGGFLWAIIDGSPESMPLDLPDGYQWDVMGQLDGETYSIIMPTADNLQFNESSLADATSYNYHVEAFQWNLSEVIRDVTNYSPYEDGTQDWEVDYQELVSEPVYERLTELEYARQDTLQPSDSSLNLPAAEDTDGDGLLTAALNISVETEYGTAILQKFTLDPSSLEFSWYTELSGLSGPFAEYGSALSTALKEHTDFNAEFADIQTAVQEVILDSMLVYPNKSHVCLSTGELNDYGTQSFRSYDTLGVATQYPTSAENPSCLEIGGVTYSLS